MTDWKAVRAQFPALRNWTFLNSATFGQLPQRTTDAVMRHFAHRDEMACADFLSWFDDADAIRASVARLIHCLPEDIAFFPNAAQVSSLLLNAIDWKPGDRILTLEHEFPNQLYIAQSYPGVEAGIVSHRDMVQALTPRTRAAVISTINYTNGLRPPLEAFAAACRANGTILYIDGTQSLGALQFDAGALQPDVFAVDGYKWLLSPNGAGFAYIHPRVRQWMRPATIGWRSDKRWREVNNLHHGAPEFKDAAERYEGGFLPMAVLYGMHSSVNLFLEIGPAEIERRVLELAAYARRRLRELGARLLADEDPAYISPIVAARWEGFDAPALTLALKQRRILTAARHGNLRVSTHFYNNEEDVDVLAAALQDLLR
ncbi:MAG: aminotransferase class V-fold PLP-dependent enzyme [Bryobacterales bacterium]|nr:aminotransferase class V-fold PLP-dependent enzyme [Bryobacterales bacterium]